MIAVDQSICTGCALCIPECPENALSCWGVAVVQDDICTECMECVQYCPVMALSFRDSPKKVKHA